MATLPSISSSSFLPAVAVTPVYKQQLFFFLNRNASIRRTPNKPLLFQVQAAKLPGGVELPKQQPKLQPPFLGFTRTAEIWNSRACMVGLIGTFLLELILNKGILQIIGVDVGKGLDLPL